MDKKKIEKGVRLILEGIGEDTERPGIKDTPGRIANLYEEIFSGLNTPTEEILKPIKGESHDEMVLLKDIPFYSVCEHHLLPFIGKAHVAYIPAGGRIVGLGDLIKAVEALAKRLQVQERLTVQIAHTIQEKLNPHGVGVVMEARHLCMSMRGVEKQNTVAVTSEMLGVFRKQQQTRDEFLKLIRQRGGDAD